MSQPQPSESLATKPLEAVSLLRGEMIETMEAVSRIADRGSSTVLLSLGAATFILAFLIKLWPRFGGSGLSAAEFIAVIVASTVLLLAGSAIRLHQFNKEQEAGKRIRESGVELISKAMDKGGALAAQEPTKSSPHI